VSPPAASSRPDYWLRAKRELARGDDVLGRIIRAYPRIALARRGEAFATLARAIVGQQISTKAAQSVWDRLLAASPRMHPAAVARMRVPTLCACGLSGRKAEYIRDLARHFRDGRLDAARWGAMPDEAIIAELVAVRGIGRWTAEMFLMFNLLRPDVLPVDDLGLRKAVGLHYGIEPAAAAVRALGERWRPWRSVATWYLWRSLDPTPWRTDAPAARARG
jgi:DNA-3-methyladenine glycosylase II